MLYNLIPLESVDCMDTYTKKKNQCKLRRKVELHVADVAAKG